MPKQTYPTDDGMEVSKATKKRISLYVLFDCWRLVDYHAAGFVESKAPGQRV